MVSIGFVTQCRPERVRLVSKLGRPAAEGELQQVVAAPSQDEAKPTH